MILYVETLRYHQKLRTSTKIQYVTENKINKQKPVAFLHINNTLFKREIVKPISFITASKEQSTEEYNLTQEVKDLYTENYKILLKTSKDDPNKWKNIPCLWMGKTHYYDGKISQINL